MAKRILKIFRNLGINGRDDHGRTRLYKAARDGNLAGVRRLLISGADTNIKTKLGLTALHQAAYWGEVGIVEALLKAGADPSADNGQGWTPLHSASLSAGLPRRKKIIKILIDAGANVDKEDDYGWSPKNYMQLWVKHDKDNLRKLQRVMDNKKFLDDVQQPDTKRLGLEKNKPEPPAHHTNKTSNENLPDSDTNTNPDIDNNAGNDNNNKQPFGPRPKPNL